MARVGGRNAFMAWIVGLACAAVVVGLAYLALPMLPATVDWMTQPGGGAGDADAAPADDDLGAGEPTVCRHLYVDALWSALVSAPGVQLVESTDPPTTSATAVTEALGPAVRMTCTWAGDTGEIHTTVAEVAADAGAIASAALPSLGFACADKSGRTRCVREDGDLVETIETGGGLWLSTSQRGWYPSDYTNRVAERVFIALPTPTPTEEAS